MGALTGSDHAYKYALAGILRAGAGRANYTDPRVYVSIGGVQYATGRATASQLVRQDSMSITESSGVEGNTASFQAIGFEPTVGQEVIITLGSRNNGDRVFAGNIQSVTAAYVGSTAFGTWNVSAIDYSWQLTRKRVTKRYTGQTATAIAQDLVSQVTGFTSTNVATGLQTIDEISFTFDTVLSALTQLANRIGGFVKVDYRKDVHFGLSDTSGTAPVSLTSANQTSDAIAFLSDLRGVITRAYEEGGGSNALAAAPAGTTQLPVEDTAWYNPAGGLVISGPQKITYTGLQEGGGGSLVGPGVTPSAAPSTSVAVGSGVESGSHNYAYTWVTGAGETLPSPTVAQVVGAPSAPAAAPSASASFPTSVTTNAVGDSVVYKYSYSTATSANDFTKDSAQSDASAAVVVQGIGGGPTPGAPYVYVVGSSDTRVRWIHVWKSVNGGAYSLAMIDCNAGSNTYAAINDTGGATLVTADVGTNVATHSAATLNQVALTGIAVGPSGTTSRKVYRTVAAGSQLKLVTTIANNTATTLTDSTADAGLGANVPTSDTSGLTQPNGQVLAGATSVLVAGTGAFNSSGGLAVIGNGQQVISYTGISGNTLTGVPSSGTGSISATIAYNSTITAAPCLTGIPASGVGAIVYDIAKGDQVNILVQADDTTAQSTIAALIGGSDDGIIENYQSDGRISETEARVRATATLAEHGSVDITMTGNSRDLNVRAGRPWTVSITAPTTVSDTFVLQSVTIANFQTAIPPTRSFTAGSAKYSFSDLIRFVTRLAR